MTRRKIQAEDYAAAIVKALPGGILLTTKAGDKLDTMVIGWGTVGVNWAKPVFVTYVREGRFTRTLLDENPEFTVNVPVGSFDRRIIGICGSRSGRDTDKIREAGLTPVESEVISVPALREFPLTLECRVMYAQKQDLSLLGAEINETFYPQDADSTQPGANRDAHISYFGEIVAAYVMED